jgi:hypothetical protein
MHQGCVRLRQRRREGSANWSRTSRSCRWPGRSTTPASWPPTTNSTCPATASPQAGGAAPAPAASGCRAKHRWPGSRPCSKAETPRPASCWAVPTAVTPCPPSTWCCGRPRASRSSTASGMRPLAGWCCRPITLGWLRRWPTWTSTWGPAAATAVSSTWPARGCWRSGSTTGRPEKVTRCCTPIWSSPTGSRDRTDAGRPWRPGPVPASAGRGRHLPGHLPTRAVQVARGRVDGGRPPWQPGVPRDARGAGPRLLQAHRSD